MTTYDEENVTEFIRCEKCSQVFDHDSSRPGSFHCPSCGTKITDASINVSYSEWNGAESDIERERRG